MSTQLQRALAALPLPTEQEVMREQHRALLDALNDAQNPPPPESGVATWDANEYEDGSISEEMWTKLRSVERRMSALIEAVEDVSSTSDEILR